MSTSFFVQLGMSGSTNKRPAPAGACNSNNLYKYFKRSKVTKAETEETLPTLPERKDTGGKPGDSENYLETIANHDIGIYLSRISSIDDSTRYQLLKNHWVPEKYFEFPYSIHKKRGREERRRANQEHLEKYEWLVLSKHKMGLFCKYCAIFSSEALVGKQHNVMPQKLVKIPLTTFAKLTGQDGDLIVHEKSKYHIESVEKGEF